MRESFVQLINEVRSSGRYCGPEFFQATTPVVWNEQLFNAALGHSNDMATNNFFSHTGSDGLSLADRATNAGYPFRIVGENIAAGQYTTAEAVDSWVNSSGHCRNLMNPAFTEVALACVENPGSDYQRYWTNVLGDRFRGESRVGNVPITRAMP
ncbi:MAG: hypothetical protein CSB44_12665 [Gammaproteobacteria bacterium]|nr:MAG: hypothetical protein CSB44_12665 [Gammaproteobacteria bacterium]PIE36464.1 MAG: hypothetical protein CSA54_04315 [Gammaproteobacteria bacterium]